MVNVNLDIAGFYYRADSLEVNDGAPVIHLMVAARSAVSSTGALLDFDTESVAGKVFLDSITVTHANGSAVSGQQYTTAALNGSRVYPNGVYANADEAGFFEDGTNSSPFIAADRNKTGLMAWQYYVYDKHFIDLNRAGGPRRVVPFTEDFARPDKTRGLKDGDTVVWRLIMVRTRPDGGLGPQTIRLDQTLTV